MFFDGDKVILTAKEYARLKDRDNWLTCLEAAGVDNWPGYDYAIELRRDPDEESEFDCE